MSYSYTILIPLLPLAGFLLLGLFGKSRLPGIRNFSGLIACFLLCISTILSLQTAYEYFFVNASLNDTAGMENADAIYHTIIPVKYTWLQFSEGLSIDMGITLDPVSVMMLVVVTFISLMVHIFSLGYMKGEERFSTYFSFLQLFTFSMLGLVMASNIFQIYIFWELVGISSYLLIGYYYDRPSAIAAAKKAFVVTRFADLGFLIGILILAFYGETLDFQTLIDRLSDATTPQFHSITSASFIGASALTWSLALVFIGGAGKSAMFPLHIWLPDAMEGPTPVSALIHAATMVVAGVYLVARLFPLFVITPAALHIVMYTGALSALLAALIACTQTDIKRMLAYSTMSQIGYMMFALGVSQNGSEGYTASMFHLFTHAFFKSLLFLCAGAVIHFVHSNEMKDMGGLRKLMPVTHIAFLAGCLAIAGVPPFAGFFSKEEILHAASVSDKFIYVTGLIISGITAFYMFRLYFNIFWNKESLMHDAHGEGAFSMKFPLVILALCSLLAGFIPFSNYISADGKPFDSELPLLFSIVPVLLALTGISVAYLLYKKQNNRAQKISASMGMFYQAAYRKFYIDEIYLLITRKIIFSLIGRPAAWIDRNIVDGVINRIASATGKFSFVIRRMQSGSVQSYAIYFFGGILMMILIFVFWWK
ncbi:MAG: NADH-quinone oxidoreductase subunit L [Chitinophagales bacterium]